MFFLISSFFLLVSCTTKDIEKYDMASILDPKVLSASKSPQAVKLQLCKEIPFKWESIIVLSPYSSEEVVEKENLDNSRAIEKMFPELTLDEGKCILLFIEKNNIVRYASVPRIPLDFNSLLKQGKQSFKITREIGCEQLYIKKSGKEFLLHY